MPRKRYALEKRGPKRLELTWKLGWKNCQACLDGAELGSFADRSELTAGREFPLSDDSILKVQLTRKGLEVRRNGKFLPGSAGDPGPILALACGVIFFMGGGNLLLSLLGEILQEQSLQEAVGWWGAIIGAVYIVLGILVRRRSVVALAIAVALTAALLLLRLVVVIEALSAGAYPVGLGGLWIGIIFLIVMIRGFGAIRELQSQCIVR